MTIVKKLSLTFMIGLLLGSSTQMFLASGCRSVPAEELYSVNISVEEIEANMQKALDPNGIYERATSYVQQQIVSQERWWDDPVEELMEVRYLNPDKLKMITYDSSDPKFALIINGERGWTANYETKKLNEIQGDDLREVLQLTRIANPGSSLTGIFSFISVSGCRIDGEEFYKLNCTNDPSKPGMVIYLSQDDFLIRRYEVKGAVTEVVQYSLHEGVMIPVETVTRMGRKTSRSRVIEYKLNYPLNSADFLPPVF